MVTINTFQNIIDALEENPALRDAIRRHILSDELLNVPGQVLHLIRDVQKLQSDVTTLQSDVTELKEGQARLEEGQIALQSDATELKSDVTEIKEGQITLSMQVRSMLGEVGGMSGRRFEEIISKTLRRIIPITHGIWDGRNISSPATLQETNIASLEVLSDDAVEANIITLDEASLLDLSDLVLLGHDADGAPTYVLAEISMTVQEHDVERARERADILTKATGIPAMPVTVGLTITPKAAEDAQKDGVTFIQTDMNGRRIPPEGNPSP